MGARQAIATPKWSSIILFLAYSLYFGACCVAYVEYVVDAFGYQGFVLAVNPLKLTAGALAAVLLPLFIPRRPQPSQFHLHYAFALLVLPSLVLFGCADLPARYASAVIGSFVLIIATVRAIGDLPTPKGLVGVSQLMYFCLGLSAFYVMVVLALGGAQYLNFDLSKVYELREEAADNLPSLFHFISPAITKVAIPFGLALALLHRQPAVSILFVLLALLAFGLTAHKAVIFYPFIVIWFFLLTRSRWFISLFVGSLIMIVAISAWDLSQFLSVNGGGEYSGWIGSLLLRRAILSQPLLNYFYWDYFTETQTFLYWAESRISFGLIESPLDLKLVNLIGLEYFDQPEMAANTGFLGSGYANAGYIGIAVYAALIGAIFSFFDACSRKLSVEFVTTATSISLSTMVLTSDLLVSFLTHGLLATILLLAILKPFHAELPATGTGDNVRPFSHN